MPSIEYETMSMSANQTMAKMTYHTVHMHITAISTLKKYAYIAVKPPPREVIVSISANTQHPYHTDYMNIVNIDTISHLQTCCYGQVFKILNVEGRVKKF